MIQHDFGNQGVLVIDGWTFIGDQAMIERFTGFSDSDSTTITRDPTRIPSLLSKECTIIIDPDGRVIKHRYVTTGPFIDKYREDLPGEPVPPMVAYGAGVVHSTLIAAGLMAPADISPPYDAHLVIHGQWLKVSTHAWDPEVDRG